MVFIHIKVRMYNEKVTPEISKLSMSGESRWVSTTH